MALRSETAYQNRLIRTLRQLFPGCFILKNDPEEYQGIPDLLILYGTHWVMLEVKLSATARAQPNQEHYVNMFNEMSFCAFIYPEIEGQVLDELQFAFGTRW